MVRRRVRVLARTLVVLASVAVLTVAAFAWVQVHVLNRSTTSASALGSGGPVAPTAEQNILLLGVDSRTDPQGGPLPPGLLDALRAGGAGDGGDTADSIIVVHVPAGGGHATAVSIPRDSFVQIAGGYGQHKINSAFSRAAKTTTDALTRGSGSAGGSTSSFTPEAPPGPPRDDPAVRRAALEAGARTTIGTVASLTGLTITHFASVNLAGFAEVSQAIGGVPVCLRAPVDDPYSGLRLPAGPQRVSGTQALAFVRQRHGLPNGDLDRVQRQQAFLAGAARTLLSADTLANPFALERLTRVMSRSITLDAGWDVLSFATRMQGLSAGSVTFRTIPTGTSELRTPEDGQAVQVDPAQVRSFVAGAITGDAGRASTPGPAVAPVAPVAPAAAPGTERPSRTPPPPGPPPGHPSSGSAPAPITAAAPGCVN